MAGDWIKAEHDLPNKPEVIRMAGILGIDRFAVAGRWLAVWSWADKSIPTEDIPESGSAVIKMSPRDEDNMAFIDHTTAIQGFASAAQDVEWLCFREGFIEFPNFSRHNGETAKTRARNSKNKKRNRQSDRAGGEEQTNGSHRNVTAERGQMSPPREDKSGTREEKSRELVSLSENDKETLILKERDRLRKKRLIPEFYNRDSTAFQIARWHLYYEATFHQPYNEFTLEDQLRRSRGERRWSPDDLEKSISFSISVTAKNWVDPANDKDRQKSSTQADRMAVPSSSLTLPVRAGQ